MTTDQVNTFLEHFGVKGMKWGVRRKRNAETKAWRKEAKSGETASKVYNEAVRTFSPTLKKLNKDPAFANMATNRSTRRQYDAVVTSLFNEHLVQASSLTMNSAGDRAIVYQMAPDGRHLQAIETRRVAEHADFSPPVIKLTRDKDGFIIDVTVVESSMAQGALNVGEEFLEHFGVKGMKWGVRRSGKSKGSSSKSQSNPIKDLDDKELQRLVTRMNLEQQYSRLTATQPVTNRGRQRVNAILATGATINGAIAFSRSPAGQAIRNALGSATDYSSAIDAIGRTR